MKAYQTDRDGFYMCEVPCQPSPMEPGVYLIPGGATEIAPPTIPAGKRAKFNFQKKTWSLVGIPKAKPVETEG